jgi:hypothetical protein
VGVEEDVFGAYVGMGNTAAMQAQDRLAELAEQNACEVFELDVLKRCSKTWVNLVLRSMHPPTQRRHIA